MLEAEAAISRDATDVIARSSVCAELAIQSGTAPQGRPFSYLKGALANLGKAIVVTAVRGLEKLGAVYMQSGRVTKATTATLAGGTALKVGETVISQPFLRVLETVSEALNSGPLKAAFEFLKLVIG
jgi:hypothetical protein